LPRSQMRASIFSLLKEVGSTPEYDTVAVTQTARSATVAGREFIGKCRRGSMKKTCVGIVLLASALSCAALESEDLLFHLSFENGQTGWVRQEDVVMLWQ